jgi:hypothetical protein
MSLPTPSTALDQRPPNSVLAANPTCRRVRPRLCTPRGSALRTAVTRSPASCQIPTVPARDESPRADYRREALRPALTVAGSALTTLKRRAPPIAKKPITTCDAILRRRASKRATASFPSEARSVHAQRAPTVSAQWRRPGCAYARTRSRDHGHSARHSPPRTAMKRESRNRAVPPSPRRRCSRRDRRRRGRGRFKALGELACRVPAYLGAAARRPAAHACASRARASSAACRFASAASTANRVPLPRP